MSMFASLEAVLYPVVCQINEYLSNYILVILLLPLLPLQLFSV